MLEILRVGVKEGLDILNFKFVDLGGIRDILEVILVYLEVSGFRFNER